MLSKFGMSDYAALEKAIKKAGSEAKLAELIGCSQVAVNKAKHRGRVTAEMAIKIARSLEDHVTTHELRPDLFKREPASGQAA